MGLLWFLFAFVILGGKIIIPEPETITAFVAC